MTQVQRRAAGFTSLALLAALAGTVLVLTTPDALAAAAGAENGVDPGVRQWGYIAAALATGLSSLAAGYAVAAVGSAAVGAIAENPDLLGRLLVFVGLAEGIAIYGLIVSILILNQLG
ncbi:MAG: ATP synthase subunit C [Thiohalospira sp.]